MAFTTADMKAVAASLAAAGERAADELNAQDGKLGDGDLGITVSKGWRAVADAADGFSGDVGAAFLISAKAFQQISSSSFGTLVATALMAAAKATKGRSDIPCEEIPALIVAASNAMMARGKAALGDKTVLDSLDAIATAIGGLDDPAAMRARAAAAAKSALDAFRDKPNRIGRARMFTDNSIGLDDPGMLAIARLVDGLASP